MNFASNSPAQTTARKTQLSDFGDNALLPLACRFLSHLNSHCSSIWMSGSTIFSINNSADCSRDVVISAADSD